MSKCKRCGSHAINHNLHDRDGGDGDLCDVCYWRKRYEKAEAEHQKIVQDTVQEKLRQQREACADAYIENDEGYVHVVDAILNAKIDNNGEEG